MGQVISGGILIIEWSSDCIVGIVDFCVEGVVFVFGAE